jgi:hypothetical protein
MDPFAHHRDLGPTRRLYLSDRSTGRVQVQPDDVADLIDELRVARQLEGVDQVRLEPNALQIRLIADCDILTLLGQRPGRAVRGIRRVVSRVTSTRWTCSSPICRAAPR